MHIIPVGIGAAVGVVVMHFVMNCFPQCRRHPQHCEPQEGNQSGELRISENAAMHEIMRAKQQDSHTVAHDDGKRYK